jgi:hypothetical protein
MPRAFNLSVVLYFRFILSLSKSLGARQVPSNTLERHLIGSHVIDGVHNLVINFSMAKLMDSPTSDFTFTYQKGAKNTSLVDFLFNKSIVDSHSLHKVSH